MNLDDLPPPEVMWAGKYVRAMKRDKWEYASRTGGINAVVILAEYEGKVILVDQPRVPTDCRCIELPAGLVGDEDPDATPEPRRSRNSRRRPASPRSASSAWANFMPPRDAVGKLYARSRPRRPQDWRRRGR